MSKRAAAPFEFYAIASGMTREILAILLQQPECASSAWLMAQTHIQRRLLAAPNIS